MKKKVLRKIRKATEHIKVITPYNPKADIEEDMEEMQRRMEEKAKIIAEIMAEEKPKRRRASKKKEA